MRIILNTFGSFGDIHPYMAIGMELQRRGHTPVIAAMEGYREKIAGAGLEFASVRPDIPPPKEQGTELVEKIMEPITVEFGAGLSRAPRRRMSWSRSSSKSLA